MVWNRSQDHGEDFLIMKESDIMGVITDASASGKKKAA
jgi:hypothetical protein